VKQLFQFCSNTNARAWTNLEDPLPMTLLTWEISTSTTIEARAVSRNSIEEATPSDIFHQGNGDDLHNMRNLVCQWNLSCGLDIGV
jgi:hypothetical protein